MITSNAFGFAPLAHKESRIVHEGPCAYVIQTGECFEVIVFSTSCVTHKPAGMTADQARAFRTCDGLNRYPLQTRKAFGLL